MTADRLRPRLLRLVVALLALLIVSGCAAETGLTTATDREQQREQRLEQQQRQEARQARQARREARRAARQQAAQQAAATPTPTEPPPAPAGSAEDYWDDAASTRGETAHSIRAALDEGALAYPVDRFVNPAGDVYCRLDGRDAEPACETDVLSFPGDGEWCGTGDDEIGVRFDGLLPVPLCASQSIRRPGALVVPVGGIADSGRMRCLVQAHGVACVLVDHDLFAFSLDRDSRSMEVGPTG